MKLAMFVVRDVRADVFGNPFFMTSVGQAERQFADEVNRAAEDNTMYKHPEDFELFHLGFFDASTGTFDVLSHRLQICEGRSCVRAVPNDKRQLPLAGVN